MRTLPLLDYVRQAHTAESPTDSRRTGTGWDGTGCVWRGLNKKPPCHGPGESRPGEPAQAQLIDEAASRAVMHDPRKDHRRCAEMRSDALSCGSKDQTRNKRHEPSHTDAGRGQEFRGKKSTDQNPQSWAQSGTKMPTQPPPVTCHFSPSFLPRAHTCSAVSADVSSTPAAARLATDADREDTMMRRVWRCPTPALAWSDGRRNPVFRRMKHKQCLFLDQGVCQQRKGRLSKRIFWLGAGSRLLTSPGKACQGGKAGPVSNVTRRDSFWCLAEAPIADPWASSRGGLQILLHATNGRLPDAWARPSVSLDRGEHFRRDMSLMSKPTPPPTSMLNMPFFMSDPRRPDQQLPHSAHLPK